jgi:quercetin dioxygenase-like cupin family protein
VTAIGDIRELLPLYALGVLDAHEQQVVERAAAADPAIAAELASYFDAAASLIGEPNPVEPPEEIRSQLIASAGGGKFATHAVRMGSIFDFSIDRAHEILGTMERKRSWELPMPGVGLVHFDGGPKAAHADCGFVRIAPGRTFPHHRHRGDETSIILAGTVRDTLTGRLLVAGDESMHPKDSEHELINEGTDEVVIASRIDDGIEIEGRRMTKTG